MDKRKLMANIIKVWLNKKSDEEDKVIYDSIN